MLEQLDQLDRALTLAINGSDSIFLDGIAMAATATVTWIPVAAVLLYVILKNNRPWEALLIVLGIALAITLADQVASSVCKPFFQRYRPSQDPEIMHLVDIVNGYRGGRYGFFSSHAANTFAVAVFVSLLTRHRGLSCALVSWAVLNCWTRLYLGVHYVGDVLAGTLWGIFAGWLAYRLCLGLHSRFASAPPLSQNYADRDVRLLIYSLLLTYLALPFAGIIIMA